MFGAIHTFLFSVSWWINKVVATPVLRVRQKQTWSPCVTICRRQCDVKICVLSYWGQTGCHLGGYSLISPYAGIFRACGASTKIHKNATKGVIQSCVSETSKKNYLELQKLIFPGAESDEKTKSWSHGSIGWAMPMLVKSSDHLPKNWKTDASSTWRLSMVIPHILRLWKFGSGQ